MSSMASLSFVAATTLTQNPESAKHSSSTSLATQKSCSVSNQRNSSSLRLDASLEPSNVDLRSGNYLSLLKECIDNDSISDAQVVHAHIVKTGAQDNEHTMTSLLNVYGKCGGLEDARKVFDNLPTRNIVAWTAMIGAYAHSSQPECAIQTFKELLELGLYPTIYTFGLLLHACSSSCSGKFLKQIHAQIIKYQVDWDESIGDSLCTMYSRIGMLESAVKAFGRIKEKSVISWTAAISSCGMHGDAATGIRLFSEMLSEGTEYNEITLTSVLRLCTAMLSASVGAQIHSLSIKLGHLGNDYVRNSIMLLYLKCGFVSESRRLFDGTHDGLIAWNAMISGHAQLMDYANDDLMRRLCGVEALDMFQKMRRSGLEPDMYTYSSILAVCNSLAALQHGEQVHAQIIKTGYQSDVVVSTALVHMYNKSGSMDSATSAFIEMSIRTLIPWTNMITGFADHGLSRQALHLFEDMKLARVKPNKFTFVGVLSACGHAGMVSEALEYFKVMQKDYRIGPVMEHYACLVDMFLRLGQLEEAFGVVKKMKFRPNENLWAMLISGCRNHGNLELGCHAADQLLKLKPKDPESYISLLNMYKSAGRTEEASKAQNLMRQKKIRSLHDWSWISIRDKVHFFEPIDQSSVLDADMSEFLDDLVLRAKGIGYEPLQGVEVVASERLAVAFGMLKTQNGVPVRVLKSNTICRDSHSFLEHASLASHRKIVVRDCRRLHVFENGHCICGGFGHLL